MEALARRILKKPIEVQVGGRSVVCKDVSQHVVGLSHLLWGKTLNMIGHTRSLCGFSPENSMKNVEIAFNSKLEKNKF